MTARLKRDDEVMVVRGRDKGRRGTIQRVIADKGKVLVEGINMVKRHYKAGAQGTRQAGIIDKEMPMDASKVMPICPSCDKPTRISIKILDDGSKSRVCKHCEGMLN
jgi:large subunit ribosomal protein L24